MNVEEKEAVEDAVEKPLSIDRADFETRYSITLAIGKYLRSVNRLQNATSEFAEASKELGELIPPDSAFVAKVDYNHYIVTSDHEGDFNIEPISLI